MRRWLTSVTVAIVALVLVMVVLHREPNRQSQATRNKSRTTDVEPSVPVEKKPAPVMPDNPTPRVDPIQTAPSLNQPSESELELAAKKPVVTPSIAKGPLDVLKRAYQYESRDATSQALERLILERLGPEHFPAELLYNVKCHTSVCKIDVLWTEEHPMALAAVAAKVNSILTGHIAFDPAPELDRNGNLMVDIYILRSGYDLAEFE